MYHHTNNNLVLLTVLLVLVYLLTRKPKSQAAPSPPPPVCFPKLPALRPIPTYSNVINFFVNSSSTLTSVINSVEDQATIQLDGSVSPFTFTAPLNITKSVRITSFNPIFPAIIYNASATQIFDISAANIEVTIDNVIIWNGTNPSQYCVRCNVESDLYMDNVTVNQQNSAIVANNGARFQITNSIFNYFLSPTLTGPPLVNAIVTAGRLRGDNFISNCKFGTTINNQAVPLQSVVSLTTTSTTTLTEYPGSSLVVVGNTPISSNQMNQIVNVSMSPTSTAPSSLVENLYVFDNTFVARQLVTLGNAQTLDLIKNIVLKNNAFTFVSLTLPAPPTPTPTNQQPLITISGVTPDEALTSYSTKFYLLDNVYPEDATWTLGEASYAPATALFDKRIIGFDVATFSPAPDQFYFAATTISCSDANAQIVG